MHPRRAASRSSRNSTYAPSQSSSSSAAVIKDYPDELAKVLMEAKRHCSAQAFTDGLIMGPAGDKAMQAKEAYLNALKRHFMSMYISLSYGPLWFTSAAGPEKYPMDTGITRIVLNTTPFVSRNEYLIRLGFRL